MTGPPGQTLTVVGGKSKSFSKFAYLLEFLNKENYDLNFTSWLCSDKGDATESTATISCPKPGINQCPAPYSPPSQFQDLFTFQLNNTTGKRRQQETCVRNKGVCREPARSKAALGNDGLPLTAPLHRGGLPHPGGRSI